MKAYLKLKTEREISFSSNQAASLQASITDNIRIIMTFSQKRNIFLLQTGKNIFQKSCGYKMDSAKRNTWI